MGISLPHAVIGTVVGALLGYGYSWMLGRFGAPT